MKNFVIHVQRDAPKKPSLGAPCNGCGVCCLLETCPVARIRFLQRSGPCPALTWSVEERRYHCGLLRQPSSYLRGLPLADPLLQKLIARWIAAGAGCDCSAEISDD